MTASPCVSNMPRWKARGSCPTGRPWAWRRRRNPEAGTAVDGNTARKRRVETDNGHEDVRGDVTMSKELSLVADAVANEKDVPLDTIFEALEAALASAAKKRWPDEDADVRVSIDRDSGEYETFRRWEIVADDVEMESPYRQIRLMDAVDEREGAEVGEYIEEQVENARFGRIAAQAAKQVIVQRVREAE